MVKSTQYIDRHIARRLIFLLENFPVVAIVGPRQVGKTTLVKELMPLINKPTHYLDLELDDDLNKLNDPQLFLEGYADDCVIIDEIQKKPNLFPLMRALIDQNRKPGRFILLGSASPELLQQSSESLAGRIVYQELHPFNYIEIEGYFDVNQLWIQGGYPESILQQDVSVAQLWMRNFIRSYIERDLRMLGLSADPVLLRRFLSMLAHYHGNIWNASVFAKSLDVSMPTVNHYIQFFESAFIVRQLRPYFVNLGKRLVKSPKMYVRDSGMFHLLAGITSIESLQGHTLLGHSWEGFVIEQIAQILPDDVDLYYYRTHQGSEIDCLFVKNDVPVVSIEIKYSSAPKVSKGFRVAIEDLKTNQNFIVVPKAVPYPISEKINVIGLSELLVKLVNGEIVC